jgi:ATP-dependent RNA helicase DHX36
VFSPRVNRAGKSPFNAPLGKQADADRSKRGFSGAAHSDHLAVVAAYDGWVGARSGQIKPSAGGTGAKSNKGGRGRGRSAEAEYCWERFLNIGTLREMDGTRRQFFSQLQAAGFVSRRARLDQVVGRSVSQACDGEQEQLYSFARNISNLSLVKCVLTAALYPSVARVGAPASNSKRPVLLTRTESVAIHPSSVVRATTRIYGSSVSSSAHSNGVFSTSLCLSCRTHGWTRVSSKDIWFSLKR